MDVLARESNLQDSVKLYFTEFLDTAGIPVSFDRTLKQPDLQGTDVDRWVSVSIGDFDYESNNTSGLLLVNCCTRQDPEGYNLVRLSDYVRANLIDSAQTDGMCRIPLVNTQDYNTVIGTILVRGIFAKGQYEVEDQTKIKPLTVQLWCAVRM